MKKKYYLIFTILIFLLFMNNVLAVKTGFVNCNATGNSSLYVRPSIGSSDYLTTLSCNKAVTILDNNAGNFGECGTWYKIRYDLDKEGYSCGKYIYYDYESNAVANNQNKAYVYCGDVVRTVRFRRDSYVSSGNIISELTCDTEMTVLEDNTGSDDDCDKWSKVKIGNQEGYVCSDFTYKKNTFNVSDEEIDDFSKYLSNMGVPQSYIEPLLALHRIHPNWRFRILNTGLDWNDVIANENVAGRNLVYYTFSDEYRATYSKSYNWETDTYYRHTTETNWWYASEDAIKYYMDPRNFLTERDIFMYEVLSFQPTYQTENLIRAMLDGTFMPNIYNNFYGVDNKYNFAIDFVKYGSDYNVSPSHLASRIIQEGNNSSSVEYNGQNYTVFNFFNIRATGTNPQRQGMLWAGSLGSSAGQTSYGRPWNTPEKAIKGGAQFLANDYISIGQDTLYFQKFAVSVSEGRYTHQYMQNLTAPLTEGNKVYSSYYKTGAIDEALTFIIPVYKNMPSTKVSKPNPGNPNYYLKSISVNGSEIEGFNYKKENYEVTVSADVSNVVFDYAVINSQARVNVIGDNNLKNGNNDFVLKVTAGNGNTFEYKIRIIKPNQEIDVEEDNVIKNITIDKIDFDFSLGVYTYDLEVPFEVDKIMITYYLSDNTKKDNEVNLIVGNNEFNISSSNNYKINILRKSPSISYLLSNSGVKHNDKYISGIKANTNIDSLINNISSINATLVKIFDAKGNSKVSGIFKTGDKVNIKSGDEEANFEVIIYGDINGDGVIDKLDAASVLRQYYKYVNYDGVYKVAADVNKDGVIDKLDAASILRDWYGYAKIEG